MEKYTGSILDYKLLRTYVLKADRDRLIRESGLKGSKNPGTIKAHMLDEAMKLACANYKSGLTNLKKGNIRYFRIKDWKMNKSLKMLDIEHLYLEKGTICPNELGTIKCTIDGDAFDLSTVQKSSKIQFNAETGKYILLVP